MKIINLTPHEVVLIPPTGANHIFPSEGVARCSQNDAQNGYAILDGQDIPFYITTFGSVTGLPEYRVGVFYIVSSLIRSALPDREDLLSPTKLIRNDKGHVTGCRGFSTNRN